MNKRIIVSLALFAIGILIYTRVDYLINSDLYNFGLQYDDRWHETLQIPYSAMFQLTLLLLLLYSRSIRLWVVLEAFILSSGHDLLYYAVWNHGIFPAGNWTWMGTYIIFGKWTTAMQIIYTCLAVSVAIVIVLLLPKMKWWQRITSSLLASLRRLVKSS